MKKPKFKRLKKTSSCSPNADSYNNQSAELIGSNDDLLTEILSRLPAKSIALFKTVSKQWLSLLTHPHFTIRFDKLLISSGLYYDEFHVYFDVQNPTPPPFRSLDFSPDKINGIRIVQSCNGLLLCCCDKDYEWRGKYYVCNPTTKKVVAIPPVIGRQSWLIRFMGLAYHPTEYVHYKLVCILRHTDDDGNKVYNEHRHKVYNIQIYSSHTRRWKEINQTFAPLWYTEFGYGVYWNQAFHWAPSCDNPMYLRMDTEQIHEFPLPSPLPERVTSASGHLLPLYFGESGGHLHLVETVKIKNPLGLIVYEMLKDHSGWFIKYQLDLHELSAAYPNMTPDDEFLSDDAFRVLDVVRGAEEEDTFMVVKVVDDIKRYNIRAKSFKQLFCIPHNIEYAWYDFFSHRYIEKIGPL